MSKLFGKEIIFALEHLLACDVMKEQGMEFIHLLMKVEEKDRQKNEKSGIAVFDGCFMT